MSSLFVPMFLTVTAAPATTSLLGFVTTPPIAPVSVDCANCAQRTAPEQTRAKRKLYKFYDIQGNSLGNELTLNAIRARWRTLTETFENC